jgi:hypothetical protein
MVEDNEEEEEEDDDMYLKYGDTGMRQAEDEEAGEVEDEETSYELGDDLRRAIADAHREPESANEKRKLKDMRCSRPSLYRPEAGDGRRTRGIAITSCAAVGDDRSAREASPLMWRRLPTQRLR